MTITFNKIHRLKRQPGWTWAHFLSELDKHTQTQVDEKTLYSLYRLPHRKPSSHISKAIDQLHSHHFPNPFPEEINRLMRLYNHLYQCKQHLQQDKDIEDLEFFLATQLPHETQPLRIARIHWLLGHIQFDRIPEHRDNARRSALQHCKQQAIHHYQQSVSSIEQYNQHPPADPVGPQHVYRARHNILACYLNAVNSQQRHQDRELLNYLSQSNYIANSKLTLSAEPFQWQIARNGLRFSSLIHHADDVAYFFRRLVGISKSFLDLHYRPLNTAPIAEGDDFAWARQQVLTDNFLTQII